MKHSRDSVRRFVRVMLALRDATVCLHQTLTFHAKMADGKEAKRRLNLLLDNLSHRFPKMAVVYVEESQATGSLHFHVLFVFMGADLPFPQAEMLNRMRPIVFSAWNALNSGKLVRAANVMKLRQPDIDYLIKEAKAIYGRGALRKGQTRWWGQRNTRELKANGVTVSNADVRQVMKESFPIPKLPTSHRMNERQMLQWKQAVMETDIGGDFQAWERLKMSEAKSTVPITDAEFLALRKERGREWRKRWAR